MQWDLDGIWHTRRTMPIDCEVIATPTSANAPPDDVARASGVETRIHVVRGASVMLDSDLAVLYGVSAKALLQGVRRNRKRFPDDFMFQLSTQELANLRSQSVTSSLARLRRAAIVSEKLMALIEDLSERVDAHDAAITDLVESIRAMVTSPSTNRARPIGFTADIEGDP